MNMSVFDNIINEEISKVINEDFMGEASNDVADLINGYLRHHKKKRKNKDLQKKKLRKKKGGGKEYYDYDEYERSNRKISIGDASSVRNSIDTEKTNIAAVARDLFPDHTEEGAQSQLRKVINGERPMTKNLASKIKKMISNGQIAVK